MNEASRAPFLVGEIFVDFTITSPGSENKLRLGGVAHAARGLWALGVPFRAAVVLPPYLTETTRKYFSELGCVDFHVVGTVTGAPNVIVITDATEIADQGYEAILRDEKHVDLTARSARTFDASDVLVFPGSYDLPEICAGLSGNARLHIDVAYDVDTTTAFDGLKQKIETIFISTSSDLFASIQNKGVIGVADAFSGCAPLVTVLKENRGGARLYLPATGHTEALPAQLGMTINSVGVGDVFDAAYVANLPRGPVEAAWRATYASAAYSQTTYPDLFKDYVTRDARLSLEEMRDLWGAYLPWERRRDLQIYLAAPDFTDGDRTVIDRVLQSLEYHNFCIRRPVVENGELPKNADAGALKKTYQADYNLLKNCSLVFAVPQGRDPGTLVEIGIAVEASVPVVVYDPAHECANTMVIAGASCYSSDLDACLNATFNLLGEERSGR